MALSKLSEEVQCELLWVICNICICESAYKELVQVDYNIDKLYLKKCFMIYWSITDEEFNAKFPIGIPDFKADEHLFESYMQFMLDKNYPERDEYLHTVDEIYMTLQTIYENEETDGIWIEDVEIRTSIDLNDSIFKHPTVILGGIMLD
jgi:hypothetical protein